MDQSNHKSKEGIKRKTLKEVKTGRNKGVKAKMKGQDKEKLRKKPCDNETRVKQEIKKCRKYKASNEF